MLKGFFLLATWITILLSVDYISEGDYYKSEYYVLLLTSAFGMVMMVSSFLSPTVSAMVFLLYVRMVLDRG